MTLGFNAEGSLWIGVCKWEIVNNNLFIDRGFTGRFNFVFLLLLSEMKPEPLREFSYLSQFIVIINSSSALYFPSNLTWQKVQQLVLFLVITGVKMRSSFGCISDIKNNVLSHTDLYLTKNKFPWYCMDFVLELFSSILFEVFGLCQFWLYLM